MASQSPSLRVRISADLADIKQGLGLLRGELTKAKNQASQVAPDMSGWVSGLKRVKAEVAGLVAAYASLQGVSLLGGLADEATRLRGRLSAAKSDYKAVLELAQETRTGLSTTADLYARMERSTRGQGRNQEQLLTLTKAVNQAVKLSYAESGAAEGSITQLGQALASGTLRGDELNSVLEGTPRLAEAIANGLGKPLGALRQLAQQGQLTSKAVIDALLNQADVLDKEYGRVPLTIGDALTQVRNSFLDYVGDQDKATGASQQFAGVLQQLSKDLPKYLDPLLAIVSSLIKNFDTLSVSVGTYFGVQAIAAAVGGIRALIAGMVALRAAIVATELSAIELRAALATMGGPVTLAIAALTGGLYYLYQRTQDAKRAAEEHTRALEANKNMALASRDAALEDAKAKRQQAIDTLKAAQAALQEARYKSQAVGTDIGGGGPMGMPRVSMGDADPTVTGIRANVLALTKQIEDWDRQIKSLEGTSTSAISSVSSAVVAAASKAIAQSNALLRDSISRSLYELDQLYSQNGIGIAQYYSKRVALQQAAIDADIQQAKFQLAVTKGLDQRRSIEEKIAVLQRDRTDAGVKGAHDQQAAEESLAEQMEAVYIQLMEQQGRIADATRARLEGQYKDLKARQEANGNLNAVAKINLVIDDAAAKAQLSQYSTEASQLTARLQTTESSVSAQVSAGTMGPAEGEKQLQAARQKTLDQLLALRSKQAEYMATLSPDSPEYAAAAQGLQGLDTDIATVASSTQQLKQQFEAAATSSLTQLFDDLASGSKSGGEALRDFAKNFVQSMAQVAAQALATALVLEAFDAIWPGFGRLITSGAGAAGGVTTSVKAAHGGGVAGSMRMMRNNISPLVFGAAPRYHTGGVVGGINNKEVAAILERGETVRTTEQEAALQRRMDGKSSGTNTVASPVVVAFGEDEIAKAMYGRAGEKAVMYHVRRNKE